jgi:hypothetical protein
MPRTWNLCVLAGLLSACGAVDDGSDALPVVFGDEIYTADEFASLGVAPAYFAATPESIAAGHVLAFATISERDRATASASLAAARGDNRLHSNFWDEADFVAPLLQLAPGESARDLNSHPCNCDNTIRSLKASGRAPFTTLYELDDFAGDSLQITQGSEIENLNVYHLTSGASWAVATSSIAVD